MIPRDCAKNRLAFIALWTCIHFVAADDSKLLQMPVFVSSGDVVQLRFDAPNCTSELNGDTVRITNDNPQVIEAPLYVANLSCQQNYSVDVKGVAIGFSRLTFFDSNSTLMISYGVAVTRPKATAVDSIFTYGLIVLVSLTTVGFGASLDLDVVKKHLKKPKALAIGLGCQFTLMPLIAFALTRIVPLPAPLALGVFASGCAPSGGASNVWSKFLGGDVDLSLTLTFLASIMAFGTMPLWIYTLGQLVAEDMDIFIPYLDMLRTLAVSLVPLVIGILSARCLPKLGTLMAKSVRPVSATFIVFVTTLGLYANFYIFDVIRREPEIWIVVALPYCGLVLGGLLPLACREAKEHCVTVAIETSIQNTGIAIILLRLSLEQPWSDYSLAVPILVSMWTPVPLILVLAVKLIYAKLMIRLDVDNQIGMSLTTELTKETILLDDDDAEQKTNCTHSDHSAHFYLSTV